MEELGQKLRRAREARGVSLRDIASRTKISLTALEALERDELNRLPGGIFSRAVVRAYATEVGLDPDTTVENFLAYARRYEREMAERAAAARPAVTRDDREFLERQRRALRILRIVVVVVAAGAVALLVWQFRQMWAPDSLSDEPAPVEAPAPLPLPPPASGAPVGSSPELPAEPGASGPASQPPPAAPAGPETTTVKPLEPVVPTAEAPATAPDGGIPAGTAGEAPVPRPVPEPAPGAQTADTPLVLELTAVADGQVTASRDGGPSEVRALRAGERLRLTATKDVVLTVGDAAAVTWTINGKPAQPLGRPGVKVRVRVTPANVASFLP